MKMFLRSAALAGLLTFGCLGLDAKPAQAQAVGFTYARPGFSVGVATGGAGYYGAPVYGAPVYGAPVYGAYPAPVVVAPAPVIVAPRPYYYGGYYGPRSPYGYRPYRPYPRYYR